jgi:hypothetical protein
MQQSMQSSNVMHIGCNHDITPAQHLWLSRPCSHAGGAAHHGQPAGAVSVVALVGAQRQETAHDHGLVDGPSWMMPMSWLWLVPRYTMMGVAGWFAMVGMPGEVRSLAQLCTSA